MEKIRLVRNDTKPQLVLSLTDKDTGAAIDLSSASTVVRLKFKALNESTVRETLTAFKLPGVQTSTGVNYSDMTLGKGGRCYIQWTSTSLSGDAGDYVGEIEITFSDGVQTVYDTLKFRLRQDF